MEKRLTYSRNVFIPVTYICRNRCCYCGFRKSDGIIDRREASSLLEKGAEAGCTEALFCLGERPWEVPGFERQRRSVGKRGNLKDDFLDYLIELCELSLDAGLLPHTNAGILLEEEMARLAPYNASMGLMLETTAKVEAHRDSPGKAPQVRIDAIAAAGRLKIPFTTGILVGIGERLEDRIHSLRVLADLHGTYGHLQEVIVQPFDPKPGTPMAHLGPPGENVLKETVTLAREILPTSVAVQVPPNLADPRSLVEAGADDLGGISPVTSDWINPERPWPALEKLRHKLQGYDLRERLAIYPRYIELGWHGERTRSLVDRLKDPDGFASGFARRD